MRRRQEWKAHFQPLQHQADFHPEIRIAWLPNRTPDNLAAFNGISIQNPSANRQIIFEKRSFQSGQHLRPEFRVLRATLLHSDWMHCLASSNQSALLFQRTFKFCSGLKSFKTVIILTCSKIRIAG